MSIELLAPNRATSIEVESLCHPDFVEQPLGRACSQSTIECLDAFGRWLRQDRRSRRYPEVMALAFWLRSSHITSVMDDFVNALPRDQIVAPRGIALHIAPSNVDTMFVYSWALSALAGNTNLVRVSSRRGAQAEFLLEGLGALMSDTRFANIASRNRFITYPGAPHVSRQLSQLADIRVLWGGNETIGRFRSFPAKPTVHDVVFADKKSAALVDAQAYLALGTEQRNNLSQAFFNDAYWFDQMACSSPRAVFFIGPVEVCERASLLFWDAMHGELSRRQYTDDLSMSSQKLTLMAQLAAEGALGSQGELPRADSATVVRLSEQTSLSELPWCGGGTFAELFLDRLDQLHHYLWADIQTLVHTGVDDERLRSFASRLTTRGVDRIVPFGEALNFSTTWDGYALLDELSRRIVVR